MIILTTPKGRTGPKLVDGKKSEDSWCCHQVPFADTAGKSQHLQLLEQWLQSYRPEELFDEHGAPRSDIAALAPQGARRMGSNPHANGGLLLKDLRLPDFRDSAVSVPQPGAVTAEATRVMGGFLRDVMQRNLDARNFRVVERHVIILPLQGPTRAAMDLIRGSLDHTKSARVACDAPGRSPAQVGSRRSTKWRT